MLKDLKDVLASVYRAIKDGLHRSRVPEWEIVSKNEAVRRMLSKGTRD